MNTLGLIGGLSWESTATYYRLLNQGVRARLGGLHSAELIMVSVDFAPFEALQRAGDWDAQATRLADAARRIEAAGADGLMICTNTMHKLAPDVAAAVDIPLLHIADATGEALAASGAKTVGLLGTRFTMEQDFYSGRLAGRFGLDVLTPGADDRALVHRVIIDELCAGAIESASRTEYLRIIDELADRGADAVILGCTEIGLLVEQADTTVPLLDTTAIHAEAGVRFAVGESATSP